jgi:hypothetical protein
MARKSAPRQADAQQTLAHFIGTTESELLKKPIQSAKFSPSDIPARQELPGK